MDIFNLTYLKKFLFQVVMNIKFLALQVQETLSVNLTKK